MTCSVTAAVVVVWCVVRSNIPKVLLFGVRITVHWSVSKRSLRRGAEEAIYTRKYETYAQKH